MLSKSRQPAILITRGLEKWSLQEHPTPSGSGTQRRPRRSEARTHQRIQPSRLWQNCLLAALAECGNVTASWGESTTIVPNFPA